jgi:hypothetical protein
MNLFKKTYLSTALAAVLAGGGVPGYVGAVTLSQDNIGDVGIVPYYTMREGWSTDFYIINTSNHATAVKVRFHEARNSREVLDFIVVLSPYDMFNAFATLDAVKGPVVKFPSGNSEKTCVVPIPTDRVGGVGGYLPFSDFEYVGANYDNWPPGYPEAYNQYPLGTLDRTLEGYFTVIEMGVSPEGPVYEASIAKDCETIENAFRAENIIPTYEEFERNMNNLKVGFSLTNFLVGTQGSGSATMLANFATNRSAIAHTLTSIEAGAVDVDGLQQAVNDAEDAVAAAEAGVVSAKTNLCETEIVNPSCAFSAEIALTPPVNDPTQQYCGNTPPPDRYLNGVDNPSIATVAGLDCPGELEAAYSTSIGVLASANSGLIAAQDALNAAVVGVLGAPLNLIHAQDGSPLVGDPERYPNLNSGDFFAYWFRDGQYRWLGNYGQLPDSINLPFGLWLGLYPRPVDAVTALLMKSDAINEWAYNANTGAMSELTLSGPTKRWYTDWENVYAKNSHLVGISPILADAIANTTVGWPPFDDQFRLFGQSCDTVAVGLWNNDEIGPSDPVLPSPSPFVSLCWEANVLYTGETTSEGTSPLLGSRVGVRVDPNILATTNANEKYNGWINVNMTVNAHNYHPAIPLLNLTLPNIPDTWPFDEIVQTGMPYIGFAFKERDLGVPGNNYSGLTPHSYMRNWDKRNLIGGTLTLEDLQIYGPVIINSVATWFCGNPDPLADGCDIYNPVFPIDNTPDGPLVELPF